MSFTKSIRHHCILNIHILLKILEYEKNEYCNRLYCFLCGVKTEEKPVIFMLNNSDKDTVYLVEKTGKKYYIYTG